MGGRKQPTFRDTTAGFPAKLCLRNERINSIVMTYHYPDLASVSYLSNHEGNLFKPVGSTIQIRVGTRHQ